MRAPPPLLVSPNACASWPTSCKGSTGAPRATTFAAIWSTNSIVTVEEARDGDRISLAEAVENARSDAT